MRYTASRLALAAAMAAGMAAPALADVTVTVEVAKTKDVSVTEILTKDVSVTVSIEVDRDFDRAAEAMALVNHVIDGNTVGRDIDNFLQHRDNGFVTRAALIQDSIGGGTQGGNEGVTGVNQDVGAMANQGNVWSVAFTEQAAELSGVFADAQAEVDQAVTVNMVDFVEGATDPGGSVLFGANIEFSINDNTGLTAVNQNAGNMNNQANTVAVAAGLFAGGPTAPPSDGAAVALAEAALGQETTGNTVIEAENTVTIKIAGMFGSVNGNTGITQVNQSAGNAGNQGNVAAVGAAIAAPAL